MSDVSNVTQNMAYNFYHGNQINFFQNSLPFFAVATSITPQMRCDAVSSIWQTLTTTYLPSLCTDVNSCYIGASNTPQIIASMSHIRPDLETCSMAISSSTHNIDVQCGEGLCALTSNDAANENGLTAKTDFKNFLNADWKNTEDFGIAKVTSTGSLAINQDPNTNKMTIALKNGDSEISAECVLGVNQAKCAFSSNDFFTKLFGGNIEIDYSNKIVDDQKTYTFKFTQIPGGLFSYFSYPKELGSLTTTLNPEGSFTVVGNVKTAEGKPFFVGDLSCTDGINCIQKSAIYEDGTPIVESYVDTSPTKLKIQQL